MTDVARTWGGTGRVPGKARPLPAIAPPTAPSPLSIFVICFLGIAGLYVIAPFWYDVRNFSEVATLILFAALAFAGGNLTPNLFAVAIPHGADPGTLAISRVEIRRYFILFMAIALMGVALRFYDQLFIRSLNLTYGVTEARIEVTRDVTLGLREQGGPVAIIGAFLFAFCTIPPLLVSKWPAYFSRVARISGYGMMMFVVLDSLLKGGITTAIFALLYVAFCRLNNDGGLRQVPKVRFAMILLALLVLGGMFFTERINILHGSVQRYMYLNQSVNFIRFNDWALASVEIPGVGQVLFLVYWFLDYVCQPFSELAFFLGNEHVIGAAQGEAQLSVFRKAAAWSGIISDPFVDIQELNPRFGKYQTFLADAVFDFGWWGAIIQVYLCGLFAGHVHRQFQRNRLFGVFMLPLVQIIVVAAFLINPMSGVATYFFTALMAGWIIVSLRLFRT